MSFKKEGNMKEKAKRRLVVNRGGIGKDRRHTFLKGHPDLPHTIWYWWLMLWIYSMCLVLQ